MENKSITFTIPLIPSLLRAMADMLNRMAGGEDHEDPGMKEWRGSFDDWKKTYGGRQPPEFNTLDTKEEALEIAETYTPPPAETEQNDPPASPTPICSICGEPQFDTPSGMVCKNGHGGVDPVEPTPPAPPAPGLEIDAGGIPWDTRIHSSGKTFYESGARKGTWKRKRGVAPETVVQVEHELKSAMAAPAQKADDITEAEKAFGPVGDTPPPPATGVPAPPTDPNCEGCSRFPAECEACKAAGTTPAAITTFAELNQMITVKGITNEAANAAALKHGLPSYAVLHARADLIPAVAKELGL